MRTITITMTLLLVLGSLLSGCDRWAGVTSGLYTPPPTSIEQIEAEGAAAKPSAEALNPHHESPYISASGLDAVFIDREHQIAWFMFEDASLQLVPFAARSRESWPAGCPSNINATRMEVLDLAVEELVLAPVTIEQPILMRDCPPDPVELVLRSDGALGGGVACVGAQACLTLAWASSTLSLPQSIKDYELYSWRGTDKADLEGDTWYYTLVTGTNRVKTWKEISALENTLTGDDWVKITVARETALKSILDRLPEGEAVFWIGAEDPRVTAMLGEHSKLPHIELPSAAIVRQIKAYARQRGINLSVTE